MNRSDFRLCAVTKPIDGGWPRLEELCEKILKSGIKMLQLRDKDASMEELLRQAKILRQMAESYGGYLIINDNVEVAKESGAHGVHLGQNDMPIERARKILGKDVIIGISVRNENEARKATESGAEYIGASGIFPSSTKTDFSGPPLGLEGIKKLRTATDLPILAIGGITHENAASVIESGADGVAAISAILKAENIHEACQEFQREIEKGLKIRCEKEGWIINDGRKGW